LEILYVQAPGVVKGKKNPKLDPFVIGLHGVATFHFLGFFFSFVGDGWGGGQLGDSLCLVTC
jgi:hypothetical protein